MEKITLVALGDSITYGYPYSPQESWVKILERATGWNIYNSGVSGDTFYDMGKRLERDVLVHNPDIVIVMGGTNDVYCGLSLPQLQQEFQDLINKMLRNERQIWIGLPLPVDDPTERTLNKWRQWLIAYCSKRGFPVVNFHEDFIDEQGRIKEELLLDGCHPGIKGYQLMGQRMIETLTQWRISNTIERKKAGILTFPKEI